MHIRILAVSTGVYNSIPLTDAADIVSVPHSWPLRRIYLIHKVIRILESGVMLLTMYRHTVGARGKVKLGTLLGPSLACPALHCTSSACASARAICLGWCYLSPSIRRCRRGTVAPGADLSALRRCAARRVRLTGLLEARSPWKDEHTVT